MPASQKIARRGARGTKRTSRAASGRPYAVARLDQMRALAHPLRLQLLEIFAAEECTTKQAAIQLGERPTRLYHHVAALERAGLIQLRRTKPNRGTTEKYDRAVSPFLEVDPARLAGKVSRRQLSAQGEAMALEVLRAAREDLRNLDWSHRSESERPMLARMQMRLSPASAARVQEEMRRLLQTLQSIASQPSDAKTSTATLTLAFIPSIGTQPGGLQRRTRRQP